MPQDPRQRDGCQFTAQNITAAQEKNPFAKISDIVYELLEKAIFSSAIPPGTGRLTQQYARPLAAYSSVFSSAFSSAASAGSSAFFLVVLRVVFLGFSSPSTASSAFFLEEAFFLAGALPTLALS